MKKIFSLAIVTTFISGCGPSQDEYQKAKERAAELEAQVSDLKSELEDLKFGASRLLAQAHSAHEANKDIEAIALLTEILKRHPVSPESSAASALLSEIKTDIAAEEQKRKKEKEKKDNEELIALERATKKMEKRVDEVLGITWISHKESEINARSQISYAKLYFGSENNKAEVHPIRLKLRYLGDHWLFVKSVTIKADEKVYNFNNFKFNSDHSGYKVWEWTDTEIYDHEMLEQWMNSKKVTIRFNGMQYSSDLILPDSQKKQMAEVYKVWVKMGGKPNKKPSQQ